MVVFQILRGFSQEYMCVQTILACIFIMLECLVETN